MIKRWIRRWLNSDSDSDHKVYPVEQDCVTSSSRGRIDHDDGVIHFTVYPAAGGQVVQVNYRDHVKDRHYSKLHIIQSGEKFGEEIEQILALERLGR